MKGIRNLNSLYYMNVQLDDVNLNYIFIDLVKIAHAESIDSDKVLLFCVCVVS